MRIPCARSVTLSTFGLAAACLFPGSSHGRSVAIDADLASPLRTDEFSGWYHDAGNLLLHTSNRGYFGRWGQDLASPSGEWPAGTDHEYLWAAGLWVGGVAQDTTTTAGVPEFGEFWNFEAEGCGSPAQGICTSYEGHPSGRRLFDDDGDGRIDEDPLDGADNDSDGRFDEDFAAISDQMFRAVYYDSSTFFNQYRPDPADHHRPLGLTITQESYVWTAPLIDDFVGVEYRIENTSSEIDGVGWDIESLYLGMYTDADVGRDVESWSPWADDQVGYLEIDTTVTIGPGGPIPVSIRMAYTYDEPGNVDDVPGYLGTMLLGHTVDPNGVLAPDRVGVHAFQRWRPGSADPGDDLARFLVLRGESDTAQTVDSPSVLPDDYRNLLSVGPFPSFPAGSAIVLQVAFVSGAMIDVPAPGGGTRRVPDLTNALHVQRLFDGTSDPASGEPVRWVANSAPAGAHAIAIPGNGSARILWDGSAESFADPVTGELDFAGYRLERAGPRSGPDPPPKEAWHVVAQWDTTALAAMDTGISGIGRYRFRDAGLRNLRSYWYRIRSWDRGGLSSVVIWGDELLVEPRPGAVPAPEPVRVVTSPHGSRVRFINVPEDTSVRIYTVAGRLVTSLAPGRHGSAVRDAVWQPATDQVGSGVYLYRVSTPAGAVRCGKIVVVR